MSREAPVLAASDVTVRYGGVVANDSVTLEVRAGEIVGLIGPNGAGKTTLVDAINGFTPYTGSVSVSGSPVDGLPAYRRRRAGLSRTWQAGELFSDISVADNVRVVAQTRRGLRGILRDLVTTDNSVDTSVDEALELLLLSDVAGMRPDELPLGRQKLVGVARAVVGSPSVLMLDEPAAGIGPHELPTLVNALRRIAAAGIGTLLIDHDMSLVLNVCDRIYVMDLGEIIASGPPAEIRANPAVLSAYLGDTAELGIGESA